MTSLKLDLSKLKAKLKKYFKKKLFWKLMAALLMATYTSWYVQPIATSRLVKMPGFYSSFIFSFLLTMFIFWLTNKVNSTLNKNYKWFNGKEKRLLMQLAFGLLGIALIDYMLVRTYFWVFNINFKTSGFMDIEFPMTIGLLLTLNTLYLVEEMSPAYFEEKAKQGYAQIIDAHLMSKYFALNIEEVVCLKREGNIGFLWHENKTCYNMNYKMDQLNKMLNPAAFVQINRSEIFALKSIAGFDKANATILLKQPLAQVEGKISKGRYKAFIKAFTKYNESQENKKSTTNLN